MDFNEQIKKTIQSYIDEDKETTRKKLEYYNLLEKYETEQNTSSDELSDDFIEWKDYDKKIAILQEALEKSIKIEACEEYQSLYKDKNI